MSNDEVMLGLHRRLHIVADHAGEAVACHHQPRIGIGERDLVVRRGLDGSLHRLELLHLGLKQSELAAQLLAAGGAIDILLAVRGIERSQIAGIRLVQSAETFFTLPRVKFLSRAFTPLNLLPSTTASAR